jgi:hypothetical protein|tara:strand:- start:45 stop:323 length:279 start_codon:yes stop_codon:yes gene_type:complete
MAFKMAGFSAFTKNGDDDSKSKKFFGRERIVKKYDDGTKTVTIKKKNQEWKGKRKQKVDGKLIYKHKGDWTNKPYAESSKSKEGRRGVWKQH